MIAEEISRTNDSLSNTYKAREIENEVREKWARIDLRQRIHQKFAERKVKPVGYVDGPPTLNGEPHMGHLRGRVMKDLWFRFETLHGRNIDFRGGWDCQGLPVELQAEKELGLTGNKTSNLKAIGEDKLVAACKKMVLNYHGVWRASDEKIGLMIDDQNAYWTYLDPYIEREWQILRSAWDNQILSEGYRVTPFCPSCQTSLSAGEVALGGYENLEDPSMYFKMRLRGDSDVFLVVWTTMPFTVITDELVGTKPDADYCYVKVTPPGNTAAETWFVGADRLKALMKELHIDNYVITKTSKGKDLEGLRYDYPLSDLVPEQTKIDAESPLVHSIVSEDFVDVTTGSGLVHMAPANGEDDFEVSRKRNVPIFNPIDGQANFTEKAGIFSGLFVRDADQKVADALKERGSLLRYGKIKHEYPICWRSGHRLVWLARREYFYFVDRLKEMAVEAAENTEYFYEPPRNRFVEIVKEKRPWCISRERVWGTPLPIWKCPKCEERLGLFSRREILEKAKSLPDGADFELHRPWIDRVEIHCPKCESLMQREPFVLDTWHNSGAAPYAAHSDTEYREYIPMPFLTEGIDQTRGWAYSLLIENVILSKKAQSPYDSVLFKGHVLDEKGEKLSKSKGNFVPVRQLLEENSVDLIRLYLNWKSSPIDSINFAKSEMVTRPYQILSTLYHMHVFYFQNANFDCYVFDSVETPKELQRAGHSLL
ncbi:MAG: class I tRNA ligase family protein, partial [Nitrososphaerales archaeon]